MTSRYLFVYGTLKRRSRHPMAAHLAKSATFVGEATIAGRLYNLGRFPGLKEPRSFEDRVHGDVYDLGDNADAVLREMDAYENAESPPPMPYERELAVVRLVEDGREWTVWVYWYRGEVAEANFIASGSFEVNCDPPALLNSTEKRRIGICVAGGAAGLLAAIAFVPTAILGDCALDGRDPAPIIADVNELVMILFFGLRAIAVPGFLAGLVVAILPRKYQQPISLVSFGTSIFGTISVLFMVFWLIHEDWKTRALVMAVFLTIGALYGFLLSVAVRFLDRMYPRTNAQRTAG